MKYYFNVNYEDGGCWAESSWKEDGQEYHCCTQGDSRGELLANVIDALDCTFESDAVESVTWLSEKQIEATVAR